MVLVLEYPQQLDRDLKSLRNSYLIPAGSSHSVEHMHKSHFYHYQFTHENGETHQFKFTVDDQTLLLVQEPRQTYPEWVDLEYNKCSNCTLKSAEHPHCPAAVSLVDIIETYGKSVYFEKVEIRGETNERTYLKKAPLQQGLSSMIGLCMAASGCPIMAQLRPLVRFHLPFSSDTDTLFRVMSMYLLAQFFMVQKGKTPDFKLGVLSKHYEEIQKLNSAFCKRLQGIKIQDASVNAVVILDCLGSIVSFSVTENKLSEIEPIFNSYINLPDSES